MRECPLYYVGNRGSGALNVVRTVLFSVLSGHWRYAHINSLRGLPYLFKLRHTAKVKELVLRMMH